MAKKKWCTGISDIVKGIYIGDCCFVHDTTCSTSKFFKCIKKRLGLWYAIAITTGGSLGCWLKFTSRMVKRVFGIKQKDFDV